MKCGREPGGCKAGELGVCPAASDDRLEGTHGGKCSGRACWIIAGTMCGGTAQGSFAVKYKECLECEFYKMVQDEEGPNFEHAIFLIEKLKKKKK